MLKSHLGSFDLESSSFDVLSLVDWHRTRVMHLYIAASVEEDSCARTEQLTFGSASRCLPWRVKLDSKGSSLCRAGTGPAIILLVLSGDCCA